MMVLEQLIYNFSEKKDMRMIKGPRTVLMKDCP